MTGNVKKALALLVALGALGFFMGSVIDNDMVYTVSGCVAAWTGLILAIQKNKVQNQKE